MSVFTYVIEHDLGFAPNPFHRVCTLACCKPRIRKAAVRGDYILGTGSTKQGLVAHLIYWMRVEEILTFDEYWADARFKKKKPVMAGTSFWRYGDNIYHRGEDGLYLQSDSFHSNKDGSPSFGDIDRDTGWTDRVLISRDFAYWGRSAIPIPEDLRHFVKKGPNQKSKFSQQQQDRLHAWLETHPERGFIDEPADWRFIEH